MLASWPCQDRSKVSRYPSGIVPTTIITDPPIQSPFLEVTFQMAVLFYRCALREGSAKQAFCQRLKLASRGYHREGASKRSSRVDSWQRYCLIAVSCGKTPQNVRFSWLHPTFKMLSPRGREFSYHYHYRMCWDSCALGISVLGCLLDMLGYLLCPGVGLSTR